MAPADVPALRNSESEVQRIMTADAVSGDMPAADRAYIAQLVTARTGLSQPDADKRVTDIVNQAKTAAEDARKSAAIVSLWTFIAPARGRALGQLYGDSGRTGEGRPAVT